MELLRSICRDISRRFKPHIIRQRLQHGLAVAREQSVPGQYLRLTGECSFSMKPPNSNALYWTHCANRWKPARSYYTVQNIPWSSPSVFNSSWQLTLVHAVTATVPANNAGVVHCSEDDTLQNSPVRY